MIVMGLILQMGITTPRQVSRHVQPKINATVASNLPPQMNSRHIMNNMPDRHGHVLSVIKSQKAMTNVQFTSTTGPSTKGGTCTSAPLTHEQLMATHLGNDEQYMVWWQMQEDQGLCSLLGCPTCDGTFAANKASRNIFPLAWVKRINLAQDRHHVQRKNLDAMSVQRSI